MRLLTAAAVALAVGTVSLVGVSDASAEPLEPLTPPELDYLAHLRQVLPASGDPIAVNGDGILLDMGRHACWMRDVNGIVGYEASRISPVINQLAFIYLCPR